MLTLVGVALPLAAEEMADTVDMKELTVVATKETSPYRRQALAVTTLGAQTLSNQQVFSVKGLSHLVPNFFMPDYGSRLTSAMYIRGVGSRINTPAVGLYVDDVPWLDKSGFDFDLGDIERIDVLRGPQGTLYGRNTLGGLVKVYSRSPLSYEGTDIHLGYATADNNRRASVTHYHHPTEQFAFSASGYYEGSDGFFRNSLLDHKVDDSQLGGGRLRGIWLANDRLSFDATARYEYVRQGAYPYFYDGQLATDEGEPAADPNADWRGRIASNRDGSYRRSLLNVGLNTEYRMKRFTLNSVTAYQHLRDRMFMDQDFLPQDIYTLAQRQRIHTIQEELTLKGSITPWWKGIIGANVIYQMLRTKAPVTFQAEGVDWLSQTINSHLPDLTSAGMGPMSVALKNSELAVGGTFDTPVLNTSLFFQSDMELAPRLTLTLGTRLDYEHNHMDYDAPGQVNFDFLLDSSNPRNRIALPGLSAQPFFHGSVSDNHLNLLPRAALRFDFDRHCNVYGSISRGMRSGGYNIQMFSDLLQTEMQAQMMRAIETGSEQYLQQLFANVPAGIPGFDPQAHIQMIMGRIRDNMPIPPTPDAGRTATYLPEFNWNYELGTHLATRDRRLQADASLFLIETRNQQIARFSENGFGRQMVNAGSSRSMGAELAARWNPNRHLSFAANYGYTHAEFRRYDDGSGRDYSGNAVPFVPRHTVGADAAYTFFFHADRVRSLQLGATYSGAGQIHWTEANQARQDYYNLLGARAVLQLSRIQLQLWGRNLTQTHYRTFYFESMGRGFFQKGRPLQVGVDVRLHL